MILLIALLLNFFVFILIVIKKLLI